MERVLALAAEWNEIIEHVALRADRKARALGQTRPRSGGLVEWGIEDGEFVGRWDDSYWGSHEHESMWLTFEAAAMNETDFEGYIATAVAAAAEKQADDAARAKAQRDAADRAEYNRLAARLGMTSGG